MSGGCLSSASSGRGGPRRTATPPGPSQRISESHVRLPCPAGRPTVDRVLGLALDARDLHLLLAREHRLEVLCDLGKILDEEDALHRARSLRKASAHVPATTPPTATTDPATSPVMPCQYQSGYRRMRLLDAGSKRKFPCGKNTSWKSRKSGSKATAATTPTTRTPTVAASAPSRTRRSASRRTNARWSRIASTTTATARTTFAPSKTRRTSAMCAYSSRVKTSRPKLLGGSVCAPVT